jgi:type I restriction enzyme S subunit
MSNRASKATSRLGDYFNQRQEPGRSGIPVLSVTMNDSLVSRESIDRRLESALRPDQHLLVKKGDIAYNMMRMWQGACGLAEGDGIVSPAYVVLEPKPAIDSRFAYHWFKSARMIHLFWAYSHGLTEDRLRLYFDNFSEIPAAPPSINDQRLIGEILDLWDKAAAEIKQMLGALQLCYRAELDTIMTFHAGESGRVDEICNINSRSLTSKTNPDFEFDYFDIASSEDDGEDLSGRIKFKHAPSRARRMVAEEGVVYATVRPLLRRLFVAKRREDVVYSTGYSILEPKDLCLVGFLKHALVSREVERQIYARLAGSGYPAINENDLGEVRVPLPSKDFQFAACLKLDAIEEQVSLYTKCLRVLEIQKRGLMQRFLADEWLTDDACKFNLKLASPVSNGGVHPKKVAR